MTEKVENPIISYQIENEPQAVMIKANARIDIVSN